MPDYERLRHQMVRNQLEGRDIHDRSVLNAMLKIERHLFIPDRRRNEAYADHPVGIGESQTISQPYIVAYMTQALELKFTDRVLEIGTGCGYQTAVLAEIAGHVYTVERFPTLGQEAKSRLNSMGYTHIHYRIGNGFDGWKDNAPYDKMIVTCAPSDIPEVLIEQLDEGGRMIIPVGLPGFQQLLLIKRSGGKIETKKFMYVSFVPMVNDG